MGAPRHSWGAKVRVAAADTASGCDQTERICWRCFLVQVSVHPPQGMPYAAWRRPGNPQQFTIDATPACVPEQRTHGATP